MTLQTISVEVSARRIATVTLNRPDRGNSFDQTMLDELSEQLAALGADDQVRVVVLRGSGRHFLHRRRPRFARRRRPGGCRRDRQAAGDIA